MEPGAYSSVKSFIPKVVKHLTPKLGMSFANIEDAFNFYNSYAKVVGLSIRKGSKNKKKNVVVWKKCVRQGRSKSRKFRHR